MRLRIPTHLVIAAVMVTLSNVGPSAVASPPPLKVVGNQLKTADGRVVRLHGVNIPSLEWGQGENLLQSLVTAVNDWRVNVVRLPLSQDRWFGRAKEQKDGGGHYRKTVYDFVQHAAARNCHVVLDLQWSNAGVWGKYIGCHKMPDDKSAEFWKAVAAVFANHPAVLFNLYNEPHDISWQVWCNGGKVTENDKNAPGGKLEYHSPGLQKLLDVCRATGAENVVVVGGLDWAYDLTGIVRGNALHDPRGNGVVYDTHIYPMKRWFTHGNTKSQDWECLLLPVRRQYPVMIGEFGEGKDNYAGKVLAFGNKNDFHWIAWCLHPGAKPQLIKDWKYTPTPFGQVVKDGLLAVAAKR